MTRRLDTIRALAICLVMLGHSIIIYDPSWAIINTAMAASYFNLLKQGINLVQMPLFFALSGYLFFFTLQKKGSLWELMRNKTMRLLLPFFLVGLFFMIPIKAMLAVPGYILPAGGGIECFLYDFLKGYNVGHLWFLPTLFAIMLICFLLLPRFQNIWIDSIVLFLFVLLAVLPKYMTLPLPYYSSFCSNAFGFVLGYMMHKHASALETRWAVFVSLVVLIGSIVLLYLHAPLSKQIAACSLVYLAFRYMPSLDCSIIKAISKNSFGLYLFHSPLIYFAFMLCPDINPLWMLVINFGVCGIIAFMLTALVRKAHLGWIIGESNMRK